MKYWGYLAAKLAAGLAIAYGIDRVIHLWFPDPGELLRGAQPDPGRYLGYMFTMLAYFLLCAGLLSLIVRDQRYRCRTCLRRLRSPVAKGSWTHILLGPPRTEYICLYGHGTLKVHQLQVGGPHPPDWQAHEDIWKELFSAEGTKQ